MAFTLPDLPYDYAALEPHIDEQTMRIHHDKHHQAYVDNANKALDGTEWADRPVESVLANLDSLPDDIRTAVRNNAGGHANHSLFWTIMSPEPSPALRLRKGGSPLMPASRSRNDRRSAIDPTSAIPMARKSSACATGCPWKFPAETTSSG